MAQGISQKELGLPNLVQAAKNVLDFLAVVNEHPELSSRPVLENAIRRYESYWLPLVALHQGTNIRKRTTLAAPLDIAWVWHVHMLAPHYYEQDCCNIVSELVDHFPLTPQQRIVGLQRAKSVWTIRYPTQLFEVYFDVYRCAGLYPTYSSKLKYNLADACERQFRFYYQVSLPHYRDSRFLRDAVDRYLIHLRLKKENQDAFLVPCYDFDLIWHAHQLHPQNYKQTTITYLGRMLKHDDSVTDRRPGSKLYESEMKTRAIWKQADCSFGKAGAMYRGDPPDCKTSNVRRCCAPSEARTGFWDSITVRNHDNYSFSLEPCKFFTQFDHPRNALSSPQLLLSSEDMEKPSLLCESATHRFLDKTGGHELFKCRVVHSNQGNNPLSAADIMDRDDKVLASTHALSPSAVPHIDAIGEKKKCVFLNDVREGERAMLVRGQKDYGVCIGKWKEKGSTNGKAPDCFVEIKFFKLHEDQGWCTVHKFQEGLYLINLRSDCYVWVDLKKGEITISPFAQLEDIPQLLALGMSVTILYLLCKPYFPKETRESWPCYHIYRASDRVSPMLYAAGYYSTMVPTNIALSVSTGRDIRYGPNEDHASYDLDKEFGFEIDGILWRKEQKSQRKAVEEQIRENRKREVKIKRREEKRRRKQEERRRKQERARQGSYSATNYDDGGGCGGCGGCGG